ncbi:MAG: alanine racemase [Muribaculaceae bacterium]|nr:alanine racemase [Muribaculaceae bacterium]
MQINYLPAYITHIITDSRRATKKDLESGSTAFVAIRTAVGDGHKYIPELYSRGMRHFIVDHCDDTIGEGMADATFIVAEENTIGFLIKELGERLKKSNSKQIVVTGSKKKTTVKELLTKTMRQHGVSVSRSPRTWNSAMGVVLSLFDNLEKDTEYIITEIGIDAPRQAELLKPVLQPEIGIISEITDEHDEAFKSHSEKIAEKIAIVRNAKKIVYLNTDPELHRQIRDLHHPNTVAVRNIEELIEAVCGFPCCKQEISTRIEVRKIPDDGILFLDSFTNDLDSLPLSLDLAAQRQAGRGLSVFLGDFDGDKDKARQLIAERHGEVFFFDTSDSQFINNLKRNDFANKLILIKGKSEPLATFFDEARHDTTLEVNLDALVHNFNIHRKLLPPDTGLIGMVKADAYGMGALEVGKTLQAFGAAYLAVAVIDEGIALRNAGVRMPIIVINPITNRYEALLRYNLEPAVFSFDELDRICSSIENVATKPLPIHIKLDTGMHRIGFLEHELDELTRTISEKKFIRPVSVFSHLATADCDNLDEYTQRQIDSFEKMSRSLMANLGYTIKRHLLNTAGIMRFGHTPASYDMARPGIGLYGLSPLSANHTFNLKPVARLISTIISLKKWDVGTPIGYGCRGVTKKESYVATLPVGYADGIDRRLGNGNASFFIDGIACPTIGNICMDQLMLDVTPAIDAGKTIVARTQVEIFGSADSVYNLAEKLDTIPYEILTSISPRVRRTYIFS